MLNAEVTVDAQDEEREFKERVARITEASSASTSLDDALKLLSDSTLDGSIRRAVLIREDLPLEAVEAALDDADASVRAFAVGLGQTPLAAVLDAETDEAWQVRAELARRPDCPTEILNRLATDSDAIVRRSAIAHAGLGEHVLLHVLTRGTSRLDAELAAGHPSLDVVRHESVLLEANSYGATALLRRAELPAGLVTRFATTDLPALVRAAAVRHDDCPPVVVGALACADPAREVRQAAAARTDCPQDSLLVAAGDPDAEVRRVVAANGSTPPAAITLLLLDDDDLVRRDAARNQHAEPELLAQIASSDPIVKVRKAALANDRCPSAVVDAACSDEELVFTAALNPSCTKEGAFAALVTIRVMPRQTGGGEADAEQRQRDRVRSIAKRAVKVVTRQNWEWLSGHPLDRLNPADLNDVLARHLIEATGDPREVVRMAVASHPKADVTVLMALSNDPSEAVRKAVSVRILDAVDGSL